MVSDMHSRHILALWLVGTLFCIGCNKRSDEVGQVRSRVDRVASTMNTAKASAELCDVHGNEAAKLPAFQWPPLAEKERVADTTGEWQWVNVWATWCKPCVEELPLIQKWAAEFNAKGTPVQLSLLSVDAGEAEVMKFWSKHPNLPTSLRIREPDDLKAWLGSLGLPEDASIPLHVFVNKAGQPRCVRAGSISDSNKPALERVLRAG